jgi:hypothetical protein
MATKSGLIASVNGFITSVITQLKLRNGFLDIINELFQTTTIQTRTSGSDGFYYILRYKKIGNIVFIDGWIKNNTGTFVNAVPMVTIPDSLFYAKTGQDTTVRFLTDIVTAAHVSFATSSIAILSPLAPNVTISINAHYQTND